MYPSERDSLSVVEGRDKCGAVLGKVGVDVVLGLQDSRRAGHTDRLDRHHRLGRHRLERANGTGLRRLDDLLHPDGVFALWSDAPPDEAFSTSLDAVFARCEATVVPFANPYTGDTSSNTVYVASRPR